MPTRVELHVLYRALERWNLYYAEVNEGLAIDGKTLCNAIDADDCQAQILGVVGHQGHLCHTEKVCYLSVADGDEVKQTNQIGMVIPLLEPLDIAGKTITADGLLTKRVLADYLIARNAEYVLTVKVNQPTLREDIRLLFEAHGKPDFREPLTLADGRIE